VIDVRENQRNVFDLMWINSEFVSNEIDENDLQLQKYDEQRI
jgi:hypothetical protein